MALYTQTFVIIQTIIQPQPHLGKANAGIYVSTYYTQKQEII